MNAPATIDIAALAQQAGLVQGASRVLPGESLLVLAAHREPDFRPWLDHAGYRFATWIARRRNPQRALRRQSEQILAAAAHYHALDDDGLRAALQQVAAACRLATGEDGTETDEAMAALVAAVRRVTGLTPHPEQLMGALTLLRGEIAEMATGEGKTLTATMAAVASAWRGWPCHVVTANDYLAARDAELASGLFAFCGVSVTHIDGGTPLGSRTAAYRHDVVYTTAKELLGDFLRDRLALGRVPTRSGFALRCVAQGGEASFPGVVMRGLSQVIVDEADSVLIDEAVTPLIISSQRPDETLEKAAHDAVQLTRMLDPERHFLVNRPLRHVKLTDEGREFVDTAASHFSAFWQSPERAHELIEQALYAIHLLELNRHFVIRDDEIVLVDELTGRLAEQRTLSLGMQQVLEAAHGLPVSPATEVSARRSFQRFFRLFPKMGGMTGTAEEARSELLGVYRLSTVRIPTHRPVRRSFLPMRVFRHEQEKFDAIVRAAIDAANAGRAVLVGMRSVRSSEALHQRMSATDPLLAERVPVLHAVNHAQETAIVAKAGSAGSIIIATNMAGRGTDIALEESVRTAGGLHVIIGEPNDLARIDRQLMGRCARQGDPGTVQCFACPEDEVFRRYLPAFLLRFWTERLDAGSSAPGAGQTADRASRTQAASPPANHAGALTWLAPWLLKLAQRRAESRSFRQRKQILEQDIQLDKSGF
ncbi:hypothetical protein [Lacisediminimonas sp.]|uniref:preprotein translocase subunit SecA n=1 Tax=Lacisediminimonas sp. TaxID=3060582 RepID=UPI00271C34FD|nr:hypothetical protein [Lacisediminimonas sp.]MDO8299947.1 hypothetical protein [Lacisediminimonas sp.]